MSEVVDPNSPELVPKTEPPRNGYGQYLIPDPETGEVCAWPRASTISRGLADTTALEKWMKRNLVYGIGQREDLFALAAGVASVDEKQTLDGIIDAAYEVAAASAKANLGTAIHRFAERIDNGERFDVPAKWRADVKAYVDAMKAYRIEVLPEFTERVLLNLHIGAGGTCDRFLTRPDWQLPRVGDLKTGQNVLLKMDEIAGQLAIYANATHSYDYETQTLKEMPEVDKTVGMVMHLPLGAGRCTIYEVDLVEAWEAIQREVANRQYRKRRDLAYPLSEWGTPTSLPNEEVDLIKSTAPSDGDALTDHANTATEGADLLQARIEWVTARAKAIAKAGHQTELVKLWAGVDIPTFKNGGPRTHEEVDNIAGLCAVVEMTYSLTFFDGDPKQAKPKSKLIKELLG